MESGKHPSFLAALCILTFIGSGIGFLGYFFIALFFDQTSEFILSIGNITSMDGVSPFYFLIFMVLHAVSLTGAVRMWKFHRDGYFTYFIAQLIIMFLPVIQFDWVSFSYANAISTLVFIAGYTFSYKYLK